MTLVLVPQELEVERASGEGSGIAAASAASALLSWLRMVRDALRELEQALAAGGDPWPREAGEAEEVVPWSEAERQLLGPCVGLVKAAKACLKKLLGRVDQAGPLAQLDALAGAAGDVSPSVDELVLSLYPPINQLTLRLNGPPRWRSLRGGLGALPLRICGSQHGQNQGPDSRGALIWGLGSWLPALMRKDPDAFPRGWGARNGCLGGAWVSRLWLALGQVAQVIKNCCSYGGLSCVV
ncbi:cyclin-D1-binding protein 1 isoform X2 [Paroedura picta]|uniref:cyclin-D1-binding protein 1 isoform X2 n=1 Tax=Paroedura picta TaxID=143630 RepID=UPI00405627C7